MAYQYLSETYENLKVQIEPIYIIYKLKRSGKCIYNHLSETNENLKVQIESIYIISQY